MKHLAVVVFALFMTGCEILQPKAVPSDPQRVWQTRQQELAQLDNWVISGRISIQHEEDAWHASLNWQQHADRYDIRFTGPIGQGSLRVSGDDYGVVMQTSEEEILVASDVRELMQKQLGWSLPVSGIRYWARGLPAPKLPAKESLDEQGRLEELLQSGWQIEFRRYRQVDGRTLPDKIFMKTPQLDVRVIIDKWQLRGEQKNGDST